jgi:tetratricopeptide (TPR) repeat protein
MAEAEKALRTAFKADPQFAAAAYNLGVLLAQDQQDEAIRWCRKSVELDPQNAKYHYTLAFFLHAARDVGEAIDLLKQITARWPQYIDAYMLLGSIFEQREQWDEALGVYLKALKLPNLSRQNQQHLADRITAIDSR